MTNDIPVKKPTLSKLKIGDTFEALGMLPAFEAFLAADARRFRRWRDSVVLELDDPMVVEACQYLVASGAVTEDQVNALLENCRSDIA